MPVSQNDRQIHDCFHCKGIREISALTVRIDYHNRPLTRGRPPQVKIASDPEGTHYVNVGGHDVRFPAFGQLDDGGPRRLEIATRQVGDMHHLTVISPGGIDASRRW